MPLKYLDLSCNSISAKSGVPLMEALLKNETMHTMLLHKNNLGDDTA